MKPSFFAGWAATAACLLLAACSGGGDTTKSDEPTTFQVGRTSIEWTDPTRDEQCGGMPAGTRRRLQAYVWYPAQPAAGASRQPLLSEAQVALLASGLGATADSLRRLPSTSYADAPVDARRAVYPVLVMSHAAGGSSPLFYASTAESLAAKGYVVVGLSHSYNALATFFADGTVLPADPACDVDGAPVAIGPGATAADFEANWQFELKLDAYLTQDIASLVRQLGQLNETHPRFAGRLQLRNIGAFGHSFGGSHAFRAARELPEIAAAANLDGTVFNENAGQGVRKPYLMVGGMDTSPSASDIQLAIAQYQALGLTAEEAALQVARGLPSTAFLASRPAYRVTIPSAQHLNFSDVGLWAAYGIPVDTDPVNLSEAQAIVDLQNSMLNRFFDLHLRGLGGDLALPASSLAGVTLEARR
jgi:predicted dienelactone hydrolase